MIELRPPGVTVESKGQPRILLPGYYVKFSGKFPSDIGVANKAYRITKQVQVTFPRSFIIKENCYVDVNLSNDDGGGERLYPYAPESLYEMLIGLKPGNWYLIPYFPANQPIYRLDYSTMLPTMADGKLRYLGIVRPADSPAFDPEYPDRAPTFKLYLPYRLKPMYLRVVCDGGVDHEKCTLQFTINRCQMEEAAPPAGVTPKPIEYLDELKW